MLCSSLLAANELRTLSFLPMHHQYHFRRAVLFPVTDQSLGRDQQVESLSTPMNVNLCEVNLCEVNLN